MPVLCEHHLVNVAANLVDQWYERRPKRDRLVLLSLKMTALVTIAMERESLMNELRTSVPPSRKSFCISTTMSADNGGCGEV